MNTRHIIYQTVFIMLSLITVIPAQEEGTDEKEGSSGKSKIQNITFSGYGAAGFSMIDRNKLRKYNQETYYEGKLQADIKINKHLDAQLDMRGSSEDARFILREFSVRFDYLTYMKFKAGNLKKPFGQEQLLNSEELPTIRRSYIRNSIGDFGYGGRSVGVMAYYNYKKKNPEFPFSYALMLYKDNSLFSGTTARAAYHSGSIAYALNYQLQTLGGDEKITTYGISSDITYENKTTYTSIEGFYVQDPFESIRERTAGKDGKAFAGGLKLTAAVNLATGYKVIESIEPVVLLGGYLPDASTSRYHTIETLIGANFYFDDDVRLRLNADLLLTKSIYNSRYSTIDSRVTTEVQVRF